MKNHLEVAQEESRFIQYLTANCHYFLTIESKHGLRLANQSGRLDGKMACSICRYG
jgi:hypothetical protein